jgi:hypothetical protein
MLFSLGNRAPASFGPETLQICNFLGFSLCVLLLSDLMSQFFFLFNLDISLSEG